MLFKLNKPCLFFNRLIQTKPKIQLKSIQNYQSNNTKSIIYANKIDTNNNNKYYLHWYALAITGLTILFNDLNNKHKNVLLAKEVSNQDSNSSSSSSSSSSSKSNNTSNSKDILESDNDEENEIEISKDKKLKFSFRDRKVFTKT
jgi:hypothetical protein